MSGLGHRRVAQPSGRAQTGEVRERGVRGVALGNLKCGIRRWREKALIPACARILNLCRRAHRQGWMETHMLLLHTINNNTTPNRTASLASRLSEEGQKAIPPPPALIPTLSILWTLLF